MTKYLYHYTSIHHIDKIMQSGYLKLTPSSLIQPKDLRIVLNDEGYPVAKSDMSDPVKPVVWMTDLQDPSGLGIETSMVDKRRIRITIPMKDSYKWWLTWAERNRMNKRWFKTFTRGMRYGSWYISEEPITLDDIEKIEDRVTGDIIYENKNMSPKEAEDSRKAS